MDRIQLAGLMNQQYLELFILPTEQCNFRCTYCYEDFEIGQMKENTVAAIRKLIGARLPTLRSFAISWFGGEPLMAKNTVFELSQFAKEQCSAAGVRFVSTMTTNAYGMDRATFDRLIELDVRDYQISIDGDEDEHDKTRKLISGRATFSRIWANLLAMRGNQETFRVTLRLHIHQKNVASIRELLPKMQQAFGADPRFEIYLKAVGNWGGDSVKQMSLVKDSRAVIVELNQQLTDLGWHAARAVPNNFHEIKTCYAARPNSFVIRADGSLAKCTVHFQDARNRVGRLNDDGSLEIENEKMRAFMRGFQTLEPAALGCPMKDMPKAAQVSVVHFEKRPSQMQAALLD